MTNAGLDLSVFQELQQSTGVEFTRELIDAFLQDGPHQIEQLKQSLKSGDADSFRRAAHSLKSNSATFGANQLAELAKELEIMGRENTLAEAGGRLLAFEQAYAAIAAELRGLIK